MVSNMFQLYITACTICALAVAQELPSFPPFPSFPQSTSGYASAGASAGSQASAGASAGSQASATATSSAQASADANIELLAHSLIQLLKSSTAFGSFGTFTEPEPYDILFDVVYPILIREGIPDASSANLIAQTAKDIGHLSSDLFYSTMAHTLAKFIHLNGALTREVAENVPQEVIKFVEIYAYTAGVGDEKSVVNAVANGVFDYIDLGDLVKYEGVWPFEIFAETLKELAGGDHV